MTDAQRIRLKAAIVYYLALLAAVNRGPNYPAAIVDGVIASLEKFIEPS